ncbi:FAD-dependent thymidylate synthase [Acinetobacter brisouii]|uniref:FAD-dependent thymidylate synthase n=1 Tax=Acinetobacter brisouii TaxID=396323 RepID=UPI00208E9D56|nr:FAD-dependent thymidylate synthase [Acinetobacter brisouii]
MDFNYLDPDVIKAIAAISVKIIADSINKEGKRITSFQLRYPRFIHAEFMTHRVFSRNASSSRAIPVLKVINQVRTDPAMPIHWGKNQSGMQAKEMLTGQELKDAKQFWRHSAIQAADMAEIMADTGLHKQVANRILEPYQYIEVILTTTELDNWFELRHHDDAQPEIYVLANKMKAALESSEPRKLSIGEWHLPYITDEEREAHSTSILLQVSAARCCRVSYLLHDGQASDVEKDVALCKRLAGSRPIHASPFEHQAQADELNTFGSWSSPTLHGNFVGWVQHRKIIEMNMEERKDA